MSELPYGTEYAKSGRSACKKKECAQPIAKDELRMSARTKSKFHDGMQDVWFHFDCFWDRARRGLTESSIRGFENLKWDDQERIRARISQKNDMPEEAGVAKSMNAKAEYSKSSRGDCFKCKEKIMKDSVRVQFRASFYHPKCLADAQLFPKSAEEIQDFENLKDEDQEILRTLFQGPDENETRKRAASAEEEASSKRAKLEDTEERKEELKKQSEILWEVKNKIQKHVEGIKSPKNKKLLINGLINANGAQGYKKATISDLEILLADLVVFGGLEDCPACGTAAMYYSSSRHGYACGGPDEDTKCGHFDREPKRKPFEIPSSLKKEAAFLSEYDGKTQLNARVYSKTVDIETEDKSILTAQNIKSVDPSRKRKKEPTGTIKENGYAMDPYFKFHEDYHVYVEDGVPYQWLGHKEEDDAQGFYKSQLLEEDDGGQIYLHTRWGKVNTTITKDAYKECDTLEAGKKEFIKKFREKTLNDWEDREAFEAKPKKYDLVEWRGALMGTYGRVSADCEDEVREQESKEKAKLAKTRKPKKEIKEEDEEYEDMSD